MRASGWPREHLRARSTPDIRGRLMSVTIRSNGSSRASASSAASAGAAGRDLHRLLGEEPVHLLLQLLVVLDQQRAQFARRPADGGARRGAAAVLSRISSRPATSRSMSLGTTGFWMMPW